MKHEALEVIRCDTAEEVLATLRRIHINRAHGAPAESRWLWRGQADSEWELALSAFRPGAVLGYETNNVRTVTGKDLGGADQHQAEFMAVSSTELAKIDAYFKRACSRRREPDPFRRTETDPPQCSVVGS